MTKKTQWWKDAVIYQIYPRSFADSNGDGIGDLPGIISKLTDIKKLGIDAVWLSPFYTSPMKDAGYDVADYCEIDPIFGSMTDFDKLLAGAHNIGIKVIIDLVPNHTSDKHKWFQEALNSPVGSEERNRYIFRPGKGENGELPPNNWESIFGGSAWTRTIDKNGEASEWYLHIFDSSQPDLNWRNEWVHKEFEKILKFWLDKGVDGFRVDVAHGLYKQEGLPDYTPDKTQASMGGANTPPFFARPEVHEVYRNWRKIFDSYDGERILCAEAWVEPVSRVAEWVRPDEMHQAFNFPYLESGWDATNIRKIIDESIETFSSVEAPATWVLSNHDVVRHASRLALTAESPQGTGIGSKSKGLPDTAVGLRRARAASLIMLALPGSAYMFQGEELGLPEHVYLPDESRQDPTWGRTNGEKYGRDGCRVPIPWQDAHPTYGFSTGDKSWLPQPELWAKYARNVQEKQENSTLKMYMEALRLRKENNLGRSDIIWHSQKNDKVLKFKVGKITIISNLSLQECPLPEGEILLHSSEKGNNNTGILLPEETVWMLEK